MMHSAVGLELTNRLMKGGETESHVPKWQDGAFRKWVPTRVILHRVDLKPSQKLCLRTSEFAVRTGCVEVCRWLSDKRTHIPNIRQFYFTNYETILLITLLSRTHAYALLIPIYFSMSKCPSLQKKR